MLKFINKLQPKEKRRRQLKMFLEIFNNNIFDNDIHTTQKQSKI